MGQDFFLFYWTLVELKIFKEYTKMSAKSRVMKLFTPIYNVIHLLQDNTIIC